MIRICGISDMHGSLTFDVEPCDVLFICGDIMPLKIQNYTKESERWLKNEFIPWCNKQDVDKIFLVGGNHDFYIYRHSDKLREMLEGTYITYLEDESVNYFGNDGDVYKFYGTPWCHQFGDWAFMGYSDEGLKTIFNKMPDNVDILVTHDAPYGCSDMCLDHPYRTPTHIGCEALRDAVIEKKPKLMLHGHLHTANHEMEKLNETEVYNVSVKDERYEVVYKPLYIDFSH